jgi:hypothetical protein
MVFLRIVRPHVLLPCVGLGSFACPVVMYSCAMVGLLRCCVCMSVSAVDSGGIAMDQSVRVLCPPTHLLCITASLVHHHSACPHARCLRYLIEVVVSYLLPPRFLIGGPMVGQCCKQGRDAPGCTELTPVSEHALLYWGLGPLGVNISVCGFWERCRRGGVGP